MMFRPQQLVVVVMLLATAWLGLAQAAERAEGDGAEAPRRGAWQPSDEDRAAYRDIIDFNIFRADRKRLAEQVDRDRNPPEPKDPGPRETVETVEDPPDPDSLWRLTGISHDDEGATAYIEHAGSGELTRVEGAAAFSVGQIKTIGYDALVYVVEDQQRIIRVGETLIGERIAPPKTSTGTSSTTSGKSIRDMSPAERLRMLRERREREQGNAPAPAPAPESESTPAPDAPPSTDSSPGRPDADADNK